MKKKQYFKIEYLVYFYILLMPIFDFISNQYVENSSFDFAIKLSFIKIIIPLLLFFYLLIKTKGKERIQFVVLTLGYVLYSGIFGYIYYRQYLATTISEDVLIVKLLNIYNLSIYAVNFLIFYKLFYRKNMTKVRMSFNYSAAIYLISILLTSLTSQDEPLWLNTISLTIIMLIFISLISLRYREDKTYSLILFILLVGYYVSTIKFTISYYGILMVAGIYLISLIVEKYVKNKLTISDMHKIVKEKLIIIINKIMSLDKNKAKRLKSGKMPFLKQEIKGYSNKRLYRYDDLNRKKRYKTNSSVKDYCYKIELQKVLNREDGSGIKEVKERIKQKKKEKKQEKREKILNSKYVKISFTILLILISILIMFIAYNFAKNNIVFDINIKNNIKYNIKYIIYFIPLIYVLLKALYFIIFKFKNIDSEFIMLTLLVLYIVFLSIITKEIVLNFATALTLSAISIILINKVHIGETYRDIETLKEQIEYKKDLKSKRKLVFGITSLSIGGVSRILVDITNGLLKKYPNLDVEIFTLFAGGEFEEGANVRIVSVFKKPYYSYNKFNKFWISIYLNLFEPNIFNRYVRGNYDTIIAFDEGNITSLFSYSDEAKKIAWVHNKNYNIYSKTDRKFKKKICKIYSRYDEIIFAREVGLRRFNKAFTNKKIRKIPKDIIANYVDPLRIFIKAEAESVYEWTEDTVTLLTVARLYKKKALDRFIRVHKRVLNDGIDHKVYIIGDGPEMENLKKLIREEKLQTSVFLLGSKINPYPYIKKASYFCLFSEKEEYSIVLNEAKILNKNILITDTKARDIVQDYPNVRVFDNSESGLYTGLRYILSNPRQDETNFEYIYKNDEILKEIYSLLC